jgi:RNA polymerase sigma-70 factor (ECF subfamily)
VSESVPRPKDNPDDPAIQPRELFEILVREHEPKLRGFVAALVHDPGSVDDLVQEAFLTAWRNLDRYDRSLPFGPWLRGIAKRLCLAHYRRAKDPRLSFVNDEIVNHLNDLYGLLDTASGDTLDEQLTSLRACFRRLPDHQQRVLQLHYHDSMGCNEIADVLGRSREAVKKLLQRSRAWLGRCIEQRLGAIGVEP